MTAKTKKKKNGDDTGADDELDDDTGADDGDQDDDDNAGGGADGELVQQVVDRVLEVLGRDDRTGGDGADSDGGDDTSGPRTQRDQEETTYRAVRDAMARLQREERSDARLKSLERTVKEKIKEEAPRTFRRLERIMWGAGKS